jgi:hypothetical protein
MLSGVWMVAPKTPNPPARLTAATTSRQWLKASRGNSIPSISQIGDLISFTPCRGAHHRGLFGFARQKHSPR